MRKTYSVLAIARRHPRLYSAMLAVAGHYGAGWCAWLGSTRRCHTEDFPTPQQAQASLLAHPQNLRT